MPAFSVVDGCAAPTLRVRAQRSLRLHPTDGPPGPRRRSTQELHVVTGAFGYVGRHIAARLLAAGQCVRTLTNTPERDDPSFERMEVRALRFGDVERLAESLAGASVLYNTYWIRTPSRGGGFARAIADNRLLFAAARIARVPRIVHVSLANASERASIECFRAKAVVERELRDSGLCHAILRPTVLFGGGGSLVNNLVWTLRRLPVFGLFGDGTSILQPVHVDDLAALAVTCGRHRANRTLDVAGPETFTYRELVELISCAIGVRRPLVALSPGIARGASWLLGKLHRDTLVTKDEILGLLEGRLASTSAPMGRVRFSTWVHRRAASLGRRYTSESRRRRNRRVVYARAK